MIANINSNDSLTEDTLVLAGLDCPDCTLKLEKTLQSLRGVESADISFETARVIVKYNKSVTSTQTIIDTIKANGYGAETENISRQTRSNRSYWLSDFRARVVFVSAFTLALGAIINIVSSHALVAIALFATVIVISGYRPTKVALMSLRSGTFDMNVLMTIAVIGAVSLGQWLEAATVMFLFSLGTMLEAYALDKTRHSIYDLFALSPGESVVKRAGFTETIPVERVEIGDIVIVKPGERIPVDGEVSYGDSSVNQAEVTGESLPVEKQVGDIVYAGTFNYDGYLEITAKRRSKDTAISKIIHMVEEAQTKKAPSQQFIARFASYYTPSVIALAIIVGFIPPIFGAPFYDWFYRALVLLVISCPCALVISTPVSVVSAIGAASRKGVLIKGGAYLEMAGQINTVVFDKTGTLTTGKLSVTDIISLDVYSEEFIVATAAAIEARANHPLASAITSHARHLGIELPEPDGFETLPGFGVKAIVDGKTYHIGNPKLFEKQGIYDPVAGSLVSAMQREGKTVFLLGDDKKLLGIIAVADKLREDARLSVSELRNAGIDHIVMLTGDNTDTAREIASQAGINEFKAELLPEDKVAQIEAIANSLGRTAMVGDGINDAPAISRADLGIAMGAIGSDLALNTADIALMGDDLTAIPYTIKLSRKALRIIKQNVVASVVVKLAFIALSVAGIATLWMAVFADTGIALLVILNGMRLLSNSA